MKRRQTWGTLAAAALALVSANPAAAQDALTRSLTWEQQQRELLNPILSRAEHERGMSRGQDAARSLFNGLGRPAVVQVRWVVLKGVDYPATRFVLCGAARAKTEGGKYGPLRLFGVLITETSELDLELGPPDSAVGRICKQGKRPGWTDPTSQFQKLMTAISAPALGRGP